MHSSKILIGYKIRGQEVHDTHNLRTYLFSSECMYSTVINNFLFTNSEQGEKVTTTNSYSLPAHKYMLMYIISRTHAHTHTQKINGEIQRGSKL